MITLFTKNIFATSIIFVLLSSLSLSSSDNKVISNKKFSSPLEYNDFIIGHQSSIIVSFLELANNAGTEEFNKLLPQTVAVCNNAIKEVSALEDYEGDTKFRDAALELFKFYKKIIENEFREMNNLLLDPNFNEESLETITKLQSKIEKEEKVFDEKLEKTQTAFAKKHNFTIQPNELQEEIDKM